MEPIRTYVDTFDADGKFYIWDERTGNEVAGPFDTVDEAITKQADVRLVTVEMATAVQVLAVDEETLIANGKNAIKTLVASGNFDVQEVE